MPPKAKSTMPTSWKPQKATATAITKFEERFSKALGVKAVRNLRTVYDVIPTGSLALDAALGIGGWPVGRISEVWGPEHAGKTTMAYWAVAEAQRKFPDRMVAWVDMEQTFDSTWAEKNGVDLSRLWVHNPTTAEDVADAVKEFTLSGLCSLVVLDSVGGMISRVEIEKDAEDATVGLVAKTVTRMVKICAPACYQNKTTVLVINQVRARIGGYGGDEDTGGGWALKHVTTVKVQVRRGEPVRAKIMDQDMTIGHAVSARIQKNKAAPNGGKVEFVLISQPTKTYPVVGVDRVEETFMVAKKYGVLKGTSWITLPNGEKFQGKDKTVAYLRQNPDVVEEVRPLVLAAVAEANQGKEPDHDEDTTDPGIAAELDEMEK